MVQVVEVVNGDALVVKTDKNLFKKVFLSSIRPPRYQKYNDPCIRQFIQRDLHLTQYFKAYKVVHLLTDGFCQALCVLLNIQGKM